MELLERQCIVKSLDESRRCIDGYATRSTCLQMKLSPLDRIRVNRSSDEIHCSEIIDMIELI